jgi:hypothetical protein
MTVLEVQAAALAMAKQITALVQSFEEATGCIVHSLPVQPAVVSGTVKAIIHVKVQIP